MKKNETQFKSRIRPMVFGVISAFSLAGTAQAASKFADVPIYLQVDKKYSSGINVKPNVMLLIDDSGSMAWSVGKNSAPGYGEKSRLNITKDALGQVLNQYTDTVNWGFQTLNNNGSVSLPGYTTNWRTVLAQVNKLSANGGTPTTKRYFDVSQIARNAPKYRCEKNYIVLMSDGDANNSHTAQFARDYRGRWYVSSSTPVFKNNTVDDEYFGYRKGGQVLSSIGSTTAEVWDTVWDRNDGLGWFSQTLLTKDFKTGGTDAAGKSWDGDIRDPKDDQGNSRYAKQTVETFTVGFGAGLSVEGKRYLEKGAASSTGTGYYNAARAEDLVAAFKEIFLNIDSNNQDIRGEASTKGSIAPAPTSTGLSNLAAFVRLDPATWSSQLHFYQINNDGSVNKEAATSQPSFANRKTLINTGSNIYWVDSVKDSDMVNADFGISGGTPIDGLEWKKALLPWTARSKADSEVKALAANNKYSQAYRVRAAGARDLGDILNSTVAAVGGGTSQGRAEFLVTAANDGMVHLFQSAAGNNPYDLKLSYIPAGMEREDANGLATTMGKYLKDVAHENYGTKPEHRYMVNGGFVMRQTPADSKAKGQQVFMFGAMGQGGRGAYALNVGGKNRVTGAATGLNADSSAWKEEVPLFETAKGAGNTLGYTIGEPQIGRIALKRTTDTLKPESLEQDIRYAGFLASGYRSKDLIDANGAKINETALYIYDMLGQEASSGEVKGAKAGALIRKIEVSDGVGGLSSPTLVDTDFDGVVDVAYAGDYGGNMYRFDLRGSEPAKWNVSRIYQAKTKANADNTTDYFQPVTSAPAVSRRGSGKYVVIFGTGSDIYQDDAQRKDLQAMYGIYDDLPSTATVSASAVTAADLQEQTITTEVRDGQEYFFLSNHKVAKEKKGWTASLQGTGERVVVKPMMILNTAVFTIRSYQQESKKIDAGNDICIPSEEEVRTVSHTSLIGVNAENGGGLNQRNARFTPDKVIKKDAVAGINYYANGFKISGLVSFTLMDSSRKTDNPVTADGDSGGSGTDSPLPGGGGGGGGGNNKGSNKCFRTAAVRTLVGNDLSNYAVKGRICSVNRISWREIF